MQGVTEGDLSVKVGAGAFKNIKEAIDKFFVIRETITPDKELTELYKDRYEKYRKIFF